MTGAIYETRAQHALALAEGESIRRRWCSDLHATKRLCSALLREARQRLDHPDTLRINA